MIEGIKIKNIQALANPEILEQYKKNGIKSNISSIVIVSVDSLNEVTSPSYDLGATEDELVSKWKKYYQ